MRAISQAMATGILIVVTLVAAIAIAAIAIAVLVFGMGSPTHTTAFAQSTSGCSPGGSVSQDVCSAPVNFFSWSCSQLATAASHELNAYYYTTQSNGQASGPATAATDYLLIMQLKGCKV